MSFRGKTNLTLATETERLECFTIQAKVELLKLQVMIIMSTDKEGGGVFAVPDDLITIWKPLGKEDIDMGHVCVCVYVCVCVCL